MSTSLVLPVSERLNGLEGRAAGVQSVEDLQAFARALVSVVRDSGPELFQPLRKALREGQASADHAAPSAPPLPSTTRRKHVARKPAAPLRNAIAGLQQWQPPPIKNSRRRASTERPVQAILTCLRRSSSSPLNDGRATSNPV
jgi:hypothetical protein